MAPGVRTPRPSMRFSTTSRVQQATAPPRSPRPLQSRAPAMPSRWPTTGRQKRRSATAARTVVRWPAPLRTLRALRTLRTQRRRPTLLPTLLPGARRGPAPLRPAPPALGRRSTPRPSSPPPSLSPSRSRVRQHTSAAVATVSDRRDGSRAAAEAAASATAAAPPAGVAVAAAEGTAVAAATELPEAWQKVLVSVPVQTVSDGTSAAAAAAQTAGAVPLAGPDAAAGRTATAQASALTPAPVTAAPVAATASTPASAVTGAAGTTPAPGSVPVLAGSPTDASAGAAPAATVQGAAAASAAPTGAAAGAAPGLPSALGAWSVTTAAAASGPARNGTGVTAVAPSVSGRVTAGTAATAAGATAGTVAPTSAPAHSDLLTDSVPAARPNAAQAPSAPDSGAPAATAAPNQPPTAAATVPQPAAQPASQSASQPAPQTSAPLQPQLAKPLFTLVGAPHGQHIMTLKVSPDDLGPLTVRAQIDAAGVRIELFAPGEAGREAVRGILPELRRELHDAGFGARLDLSDRSGPMGLGPGRTGDSTGRRTARVRTGPALVASWPPAVTPAVTAPARAAGTDRPSRGPDTAGTPWPMIKPYAPPGY